MKYIRVIIGLVIIGASLKVYLTKMQGYSFIEPVKEVILPQDPLPEYKFGYQVNNLWHIEDVKQNYNCTDEEAMEVLVEALDNEATIEQIFFAVNFHAEEQGLTKIEE